MLTAELLKRNNRLNQDPIEEEDDGDAEKQKVPLKLKRRISREPNTGKIVILPEDQGQGGGQYVRTNSNSTAMLNISKNGNSGTGVPGGN